MMRVLLGLLLLSLATPASAKIITVTFTARVQNGSFVTERFGPSTDLTGQLVTAVYRVDDALPGSIMRSSDDPGLRSSSVDGGDTFGVPSPVSATLRIGDAAPLAFSGNDRGYFYVYNDRLNLRNDGIGASAVTYVPTATGAIFGLLDFTIYSSPSGTTDGDLRHPFSYIFQAADSFLAQTRYETFSLDDQGNTTSFFSLFAEFEPLTITVADATAVPEPSAWILMIVGFGGIAGALRRRRPIAPPRFA